MSRFLTTGFEEQDLTNSMWTSTVGTAPTISAVNPNSGGWKMLTAATAALSLARFSFSANKTSGTLFARFAFSSSDATPSADCIIYAHASSAGTAGLQIILLTTGVLQLKNAVGSTTINSTVTLADNTWYYAQVGHLIDDTVGTMTLRLYDSNGTQLETEIVLDGVAHVGEDTKPTDIARVEVGKGTAVAIAMSYDDVAVNSETVGAGQTSYPGIWKTYMLLPDSNVSITWETNGSATDDNSATFDNLNDVPVVTPTAYNTTHYSLPGDDILGSTDRFGLTDLGAEVPSTATINIVDVYARYGSDQTNNTRWNAIVYDELGATTTGGVQNCNTATWKRGNENEHCVHDATGKTKANIASYNVGYATITDVNTRERRIAAMWANVEWWPAAGASVAQTVPAFQFPGAMIGRRYV